MQERKQSHYEDYDVKSKFYDKKRLPVDVDIILGQLDNPKEAMVLDAGAGSGNYAMEICKNVKKLVAFEVNDGMISNLNRKIMEQNVKNIEVIQGSLLDDEIKELADYKGQFDLITINMVIHHLDTDRKTYPNFKKVVKSLITFLKPGGKICINHMCLENLQGVWYLNVLKEAADHHFGLNAPKEVLQAGFEEAGFINYERIPGFENYFGLQYYDCSAPFDEAFRNTDSFFTDTKEFLEPYQSKLRDMILRGTMPQFLADCETIKQKQGFASFFVGEKPQE